MRLLIISNRLPVVVNKGKDSFSFAHSAGGLVTGVADYLDYVSRQLPGDKFIDQYLWIGWPGVTIEDKYKNKITQELLEKFNAVPVFVPEKQMDKFYQGFCNKTLWPLFHYFPLLTIYDEHYWESYKAVNELFFNTLSESIQEDDIIWIHDYHLLLLPEMLRRKYPNVKIGFFLHIPFPAFEIFRLLPAHCRESLLKGILGADLIGFHTHEYTQYFLHCAQRILGIEHNLGKMLIDERVIKADTFPMGINFDKFSNAETLAEVRQEENNLRAAVNSLKVILSIDRLDYTKGILNRLHGYEKFLETYREWHKKTVLILVIVPSRAGIEHYQQIKKQADEIVGKINGKFGDINWMPILYQYKFFEFPYLSALYKISDVALVTPLRDGMNLIAKEYVASRKDKKGVLILSEMTGAAKELGEALIVNPNSIEAIADSLNLALSMKEEEQTQRNQIMQARLSNYNVVHWAEDFLRGLQKTCDEKLKIKFKFMTFNSIEKLTTDFYQAKKRILFLDYDGTLTPLEKYPYLAKPTESTINLLKNLCGISDTTIVLISGRSKSNLQDWFNFSEINLVAEHGIWMKETSGEWKMIKPFTAEWKPQILPILQMYADRVPGTFVENKEYSVCWHYRNADPEFAATKAKELTDDLVNFTANVNLQVLQGNKIIEVRNNGINKGSAALNILDKKQYDFILALGDDLTDEDLFDSLPKSAYSVKVGLGRSRAKYTLPNNREAISLLQKIVDYIN